MGCAQRTNHGFSMVELMFVLAIAGVLAGLAAPSVREMIFNNRISSSASDLHVDLATARSESARRNLRITLCKNANDGTKDTACSTTSAWSDGWLMFVDTDGDGVLDAGETLLRVRQALPTGLTVSVTGLSNFVQAKPAGSMTPIGTWKICDDRVGNFGRLITITATGRASVAASQACPEPEPELT